MRIKTRELIRIAIEWPTLRPEIRVPELTRIDAP
jgi:hypothetical protein